MRESLPLSDNRITITDGVDIPTTEKANIDTGLVGVINDFHLAHDG